MSRRVKAMDGVGWIRMEQKAKQREERKENGRRMEGEWKENGKRMEGE
jgi:hypothetical protein